MKLKIKSGFTLIEILFTIILVGLVTGLIVWLFSMSHVGKTEDAKVAKVIDTYRQIDDAASYYMAKYSKIPTKEELLKTGILKSWPETGNELIFNESCLLKVANPKEYLLVFEDLVGGPEYDLLGFIPCVEFEYALLYNNSSFKKLNVAINPFSPSIAFAADVVSLESISSVSDTRDEADKKWKTKAFDFDSSIYGVVYTIEDDLCKTKEECDALVSPDKIVTLDPQKETSTWLKENKGESNEPDFEPSDPDLSDEYIWKLHDDIYTACSKTCGGVKSFPYVCTRTATDESSPSEYCLKTKPADYQEPCNTGECYTWQGDQTSLCINGQIELYSACTDINTQEIVDDALCPGQKPNSTFVPCDKSFDKQCFYTRNNTRVSMTSGKYNFYVGAYNPISPGLSVTNQVSSVYENESYVYEQGELAEPLQWQICITPKEGKNGWQYSGWGLCNANTHGSQQKTLTCMINGKYAADSLCGTKPSLPSVVSRACLVSNPPDLYSDALSDASTMYLTIGGVTPDLANAPLRSFNPTRHTYQIRLNSEARVNLTQDSIAGFSDNYFIKVKSSTDSLYYVPDIQNEIKRSYGSGSLLIMYKAKKLSPSFMYPEGSTYWSTGAWTPCLGGCGMGEKSRQLTCRNAGNEAIDNSYCDQDEKPIDKETCDTGFSCNGFGGECYSVDPALFDSIPSTHSTDADKTALYLKGKKAPTFYGVESKWSNTPSTYLNGKVSPASVDSPGELLQAISYNSYFETMYFPSLSHISQAFENPESTPFDDTMYPMSLRESEATWNSLFSPQLLIGYQFKTITGGDLIVAYPGKKIATKTYTVNSKKVQYQFFELCLSKVSTMVYEDVARPANKHCGFVPFTSYNVYSCKIVNNLPYLNPSYSLWMGSAYTSRFFDKYNNYDGEYSYSNSPKESGDMGFCGLTSAEINAYEGAATKTSYMPDPCKSGTVVTGENCVYCPYGSFEDKQPTQNGITPVYYKCYSTPDQDPMKSVSCHYWDGRTVFSSQDDQNNAYRRIKWSIAIP